MSWIAIAAVWHRSPAAKRTGAIVRAGLRVPGEAALAWWSARLGEAGAAQRQGRAEQQSGLGLGHTWQPNGPPVTSPEAQVRTP